MTTNDRNNRTRHRVAMSRVELMDGTGAVGHLAADIGTGARRRARSPAYLCRVPVKVPILEYSLTGAAVPK